MLNYTNIHGLPVYQSRLALKHRPILTDEGYPASELVFFTVIDDGYRPCLFVHPDHWQRFLATMKCPNEAS